MKFILFFLLFISTFGFSQIKIKTGIWRGVLLLNEQNKTELPFNFEVKFTSKNVPQLIIHNADERIVVDEISISKDSFNFKMPVFDSGFKTKFTGDSIITGIWINHAKKDNNIMLFSAKHGNKKRFNFVPKPANLFYDGKWEVTFSAGTADSSKAIGIFTNVNKTAYVKGTFLTETGDYRYLDGIEHDGKLYLSSFDGSHAFLFIAESNGTEIINGDFYSGKTWHEKWIAKRNNSFELRNPESLTYVTNTNNPVNFSFQNTKNELISLNDVKYKNKPVIIQIMGTWCPNCMDESKYLSEIYKKYNQKGIEIIALAYERTTDTEKAKNNVNRLVKRFEIDYEVLLTGLTGKEKASESLPFLNKVMAFPTTIFLDSSHKVKSIYTGFNGPATGTAYEEYTAKTEKLIKELISK